MVESKLKLLEELYEQRELEDFDEMVRGMGWANHEAWEFFYEKVMMDFATRRRQPSYGEIVRHYYGLKNRENDF